MIHNREIEKDFEKANFEQIKSEINGIVFDEKEWIDGKICKISEVTYTYYSEENFDLNKTLFCDIWEANLQDIKDSNHEKRKKIILAAKDKLTVKINDKIELIKRYLKTLQDIVAKNEKEELEKELLINALQEKQDLLNYTLKWIPYELEKAWIFLEYNETEINEEQGEIDKKVFGWKIIENPQEVIMCYENIFEYFEENKENLTGNEKKRFLYFLEKIRSFLPNDYSYSKKEKPKSLLKKYENMKIKDKLYIPAFNLFIDALQEVDSKVEQKENIWSIYDWYSWIIFPKNKKFQEIPISRVLKLNAHEIWTHAITNHNHIKNFWNVKLAKETEKDEWVAKFKEYLLEYWKQLFKKDKQTWKTIIDKSKFFITDVFAIIAFWEVLDNNEFLEFLELKNKLKPEKISPKDRFLRAKRSNKSWVQHKDCSYMRWLFRLINEVNTYILSDGKEWIKFEDLFLWKVWFDEVNKFKKVIWEEQIDNSILPNFSSEAILFFLERRETWEEITQEGFLKYLQNRYPIMDFSKQKIEQISYKTKRNLFWVLKIIENSINWNWENNEDFIKDFIKNINKLWDIRRTASQSYISER